MKEFASPTILLADDDEEDRSLALEALEGTCVGRNTKCVADGQELVDYLLNKGKFADKAKFPAPGLILLDLNMPKKDGLEALKEIKSYEHLRSIPVVIMTTSTAEEDILKAYEFGVNSFIAKPITFPSLVDTMNTLCKYWFETVKLPGSLTRYTSLISEV